MLPIELELIASGADFRAARNYMGLTQYQLAVLFSVCVATIVRLEKGRTLPVKRQLQMEEQLKIFESLRKEGKVSTFWLGKVKESR